MRLPEWLAHQQAQHPKEIELGLSRVREVAKRLGLLPFRVPSVIIGGTNGKGSTVAFLGGLAKAAGCSFAAYTSPHLQRYNERVAINGVPVADAVLEAAFDRIEAARLGAAGEVGATGTTGEGSDRSTPIPLTFFEYGTLAALVIFAEASQAGKLDVAFIEVGLGGRLDATNIIDAEVAVITSIGLDHMDWLGPTVEHIGREKAHIARAGRPVILGQNPMPESVHATLKEIGASPRQIGVDFAPLNLSNAALAAPVQAVNAAVALEAWRALPGMPRLSDAEAEAALASARVAGRLQRYREAGSSAQAGSASEAEGPEWILDVAHNTPAAEALAQGLAAMPRPGRRYGVVGIFADKDAAAILQTLAPEIDGWILCGLPGERGGSPEALRARLPAGLRCLALVPDVAEACTLARSLATSSDQILVCGSFQTVGPALDWLQL